jgi:hypothetical protein
VRTVYLLLVSAASMLWVCSASAQPGATPKKLQPVGKAAKAAVEAQDGNGAAAAPTGKMSGAKKPAIEKTAATASASQPRGASWQAQDSYIEIIREPNGRPLLVIHYPWKAHSRPSIEIRQLAADEKDTGEIRPLGFRSRIMKGDVTAAVYQCRDRSAETPVSRKLKYEGQDYELVGMKNRLGGGSVYAVFPSNPDAKDPIERAVARLVYPLLACWAMDDRTLVLELPEQYFAEPCWIRVWLLREGSIVWWKTVRWTGGIGTREASPQRTFRDTVVKPKAGTVPVDRRTEE